MLCILHLCGQVTTVVFLFCHRTKNGPSWRPADTNSFLEFEMSHEKMTWSWCCEMFCFPRCQQLLDFEVICEIMTWSWYYEMFCISQTSTAFGIWNNLWDNDMVMILWNVLYPLDIDSFLEFKIICEIMIWSWYYEMLCIPRHWQLLEFEIIYEIMTWSWYCEMFCITQTPTAFGTWNCHDIMEQSWYC